MMFSQTITCDKMKLFHMVENGKRWLTNDHKQRDISTSLNISTDIPTRYCSILIMI